jgi:hypothetical protein
MTCQVCGSPLPPARPGRPRHYCSDECRQFAAYLAQVVDRLEKVRTHTTPKAALEIRAQLWRIANQLNKKTA